METSAGRGAAPGIEPSGQENALARFFHFREYGTNLSTELLAGLTTFMVMSYIIFVNPSILTAPKVPDQLSISAVTTSTALVAGVMTIAMGVFTNRAYCLAPGLGLNAIVAFQLMGPLHLTAAEAMGMIVAEGAIMTLLVVVGVRRYIMAAVPLELKKAISVGIGLFILFIGLRNGGIIVANPDTLVTMGNLRGVPVLITAIGLLLTIGFLALRVHGAILWGVIGSTVAAIIARAITGTTQFGPGVAQIPHKWVGTPDFSRVGDISFSFFGTLGILTATLLVLALMMSDFFDAMGTLIGVGSEAGYLNPDGELPGVQGALFIDGLAAMAGGLASASSATTYVESAAGVGVGGRSGLVAVVCGVLFLLAMPFWPIVGVVPSEATAPALIVVGWMMTGVLATRREVLPDGSYVSTGGIDFSDLEIGLPVVATMVMMPLTYNITNGIGAGFVLWTLIKLLRGKFHEIHPVMYVLTAAFMIYFLRTFLGVTV